MGNVIAVQVKKLYVLEAWNDTPLLVNIPEDLPPLNKAAISGETLDHFLNAERLNFRAESRDIL